MVFNHGEYNGLEKKLINLLEEKNIKYYQNLEELNIDNIKLYFLNSKLYGNENDNLNVIYIIFKKLKLLLMGDAGIEVEEDIMKKYELNDLLLFNKKYNCYVVVEIKVTEFKVEYIAQVQKYMNYIDNNLKKIGQDKTIGIIICKQNNKYAIKYCSDERIIAREYELV